ncbi:PTST homolog 2, chloroplastic-like protein [Drosera capensis]
MASLIAASTHLSFPPKPYSHCPSPISRLIISPFPLIRRNFHPLFCFKLGSQNPDGLLTVLSGSDRVLGSCKKVEKGDSDVGLEGKIVEFMNGSKKPDKFPTRKELIEAGRLDLVEGIVNRGGWMVLGWDVDDEKEKLELVDWRAELEKCGLSGGEGREGDGCGVRRGFEGSWVKNKMDAYAYDRSLWETKEGDKEMVAEIVEFMKKSKKPNRFPYKQELIGAGRKDLVDAIVKRGGWMTLGWDEDYAKGSAEGVFVNDGNNMPPGHVLPSEEKSGAFENGGVSSSSPNNSLTAGIVEEPFTAGDSPIAVYSSDRSLEIVEEHTGIEGILTRLEKQRNSALGMNLVKDNTDSLEYRHLSRVPSYADSRYSERSQHTASMSSTRKTNEANELFSRNEGLRNSLKPDSWRTWSIQRAGENDFDESGKRRSVDSSKEGLETSKDVNESLQEFDACTQIRTRLQHLEGELSSALCLLRPNPDDVPEKDQGQSSDELNKLSDAWEFKENEIMRAKDKLRSIRANVAVLEGKMALAINDAQRVVDDKQRRISDARMALQFLRTACIVWPNSASEVLLSGSFDGWTTQRKMEKSVTGVFSLTLKLYPGKYEMKFIVDGIWRVDPLRPVVHNEGYENNLLFVE